MSLTPPALRVCSTKTAVIEWREGGGADELGVKQNKGIINICDDGVFTADDEGTVAIYEANAVLLQGSTNVRTAYCLNLNKSGPGTDAEESINFLVMSVFEFVNFPS